jgi:hypothetical protein
LLIDDEILVFGDFHLGVQEHLEGLPNIQLKEIFEKGRDGDSGHLDSAVGNDLLSRFAKERKAEV